VRPLPRPFALPVGLACATLLLAACGTQLDPTEVLAGPGDESSQAVASAPDVPGDVTTPPLSADSSDDPGVAVDQGTDASSLTVDGPAAPSDAAPVSDSGVDPASAQEPERDADAGSCDGFANQTGITDDTITISNSVDISGPVPGLMQPSQDAVRAYAAYFNSTSDICGRKLAVLGLDSRTDAAADQVAYARACAESFAAVGSMSAFDAGGGKTAEQCGLPDLRAASATLERSECSTCFGAFSLLANEFENAVPDFVRKNYPEGAKRAAYVWINVGAVPANANYQADAMEKRGVNFVVRRPIDISEFNYTPHVQALKDADVEYVQFLGSAQHAVRMVQAMKQNDYSPDLIMMSQPMYEDTYIEQAGEASEGTHVFVTHTPFFEAGGNPEISLYMRWLDQVRPGAKPTSYGLFSWSAAKLFVERAVALGGRLTRSTLLQEIRGVRNWTADGAHTPQNVGTKRTAECWRFIKVSGGRWVAAGEKRFTCSGTTTVPK